MKGLKILNFRSESGLQEKVMCPSQEDYFGGKAGKIDFPVSLCSSLCSFQLVQDIEVFACVRAYQVG